MISWVQQAPNREAYQKRLAIWLTVIGPFYAHEVAQMLCISRQAVWLWISQYNKNGPDGLERQGRGGRRWSYLPWVQEQALLKSFEESSAKGEFITVKQFLPEIKKLTGKEVSLSYVYKLLYRHNWRKLGPRPHHIKADLKEQEEFKKNSPPSSKRP